jgi:hypothetical protein
MIKVLRSAFVFALALDATIAACSGNSNSAANAANTGQSCTTAGQCFAGVDAGTLLGAPACLDKVPGGYCTHACTQDTDCCAVAGECPQALAEVCAPFESTGAMDCFLSCEDTALMKAGFTDSTAYCAKFANAAFNCRSTGGGSQNRKVCVP